MLKTCSKCGSQKPADANHFMRAKIQSSGLRPECKDCTRAIAKAHYIANRDKRRADVKAYQEANREVVNAKQRDRHHRKMTTDLEAYRAKRAAYHQRAGKQKFRAYFKARMASDPQFRASTNLGARFRQFVKNKPQGGFQAIVGYTYAELYAHIERQFDQTMGWDNYGTVWEIDHRRPVSSFNLPAEAALCWALSNLRPLACSENKRKSNKIIPEIIGIH